VTDAGTDAKAQTTASEARSTEARHTSTDAKAQTTVRVRVRPNVDLNPAIHWNKQERRRAGFVFMREWSEAHVTAEEHAAIKADVALEIERA
jgi:hypothetical protein